MGQPITKDQFAAGAQAVMDITDAMLKSVGECLKLHGNDPNNGAILGAATAMFIDKITTDIDPSFKRFVLALLTAGQRSDG